jgi:hypothetical protein
MFFKSVLKTIICASSLVVCLQAIAADNEAANSVDIQFTNHRFIPAKVQVRAGVSLTIRVLNSSKERIEFESFKLGREKVVEPGKTVVLQLPPLHIGTYDFYDDFHDDVPKGEIVAK